MASDKSIHQPLTPFEQDCYDMLDGLNVSLWGNWIITHPERKREAAIWLAQQIRRVGTYTRIRMTGEVLEHSSHPTPDTTLPTETPGVDSEEE